jgi:uncharacterized membrane protein
MPPTSKMSRRQKLSFRDSRAKQAAASATFVPALIFGLSLLATIISQSPFARNELLYRVFTVLLSASFTLSGLAHFYAPLFAFYKSMVFLRFEAFWIYGTGALMVMAGLGLLVERWRAEAAMAVVYILVLVFPANVACVFMKKPRDIVFGGSYALALARLPFQFTYIAWAMWINFGY